METKNTPDTGPALTPEERQTLINHGIDPDSGMPLEVAQAMERDRAVMLSGDAPFDDRVRTAEQIAESLAKERAQLAREEEKKKRHRDRVAIREASRANSDERQLAKLISQYEFFNPLSEEELKKCELLTEWRRGDESRPRRKMVFNMLYHYTRVQLTAGGAQHVIMTKGCNAKGNSEAYRIADLFIYLLWDYRKPGNVGVPIADQHLNLSLNRCITDLNAEPELVKMLEQYRSLMVGKRFIRKGHDRSSIPGINATIRRHKCATLTEEMRKLTGELATLRADVVALRAEHNALQSHHTTAHGVTVNRFNDISTSVEVHKQNLITVLNITSNLENRLATLEEKKQCLNAADSICSEAEIVPQ